MPDQDARQLALQSEKILVVVCFHLFLLLFVHRVLLSLELYLEHPLDGANLLGVVLEADEDVVDDIEHYLELSGLILNGLFFALIRSEKNTSTNQSVLHVFSNELDSDVVGCSVGDD